MTVTPEPSGAGGVTAREVAIPPFGLGGTLRVPAAPLGIVVFAHGSGSSRFSPRNNAVAEAFALAGIATLLFDLLTPDEEGDRRNVFDIPLLAGRLVHAVEWVSDQPDLARLPLGLYGASTGAAAALVAAARLGRRISAVVSRGGRPDLAGAALAGVGAPTLLIVGGADHGVIELNEDAAELIKAPKKLQIVPGATHLFEEPGAMEAVIDHARRWFSECFRSVAREPEDRRQNPV
jgi:dienelactone hydrolase